MSFALRLGLVAVVVGCNHARSPVAVRTAYLEAVQRNDPKAAYDLLSAPVRAQVPYKDFVARWRADTAERALLRRESSSVPRDHQIASRTATTLHPDGVALHWAQVGGRWRVVRGLPGIAYAATPYAAIRGLIAAIGRLEWSGAHRYLAPALVERVAADWAERIAAIEAALAKPDSLELSEDLQRAQLRYSPERAITLEQTANGWQITAFE